MTDRPAYPGISQRWAALVPYRQRLVGLALRRNAGDQAEDVAHQALLKAVQRANLDLADPWPYLAVTAANLCNDLHRQATRQRALTRHRALLPRPGDPSEGFCDRAEAWAAADELRKVLPADLVNSCLQLASKQVTWQRLADQRQEPEPQLRTRVRRAYLTVRQRVTQWRRV